MILELVVSLTVSLTGASCAGLDNATNKAVWDSPRLPLTSTTYTDDGDLWYEEPIPTKHYDVLHAIIAAEDSLAFGEPGHKVPIRCVWPA